MARNRADAPCWYCKAKGLRWDRLGGLPVCPDCQEMLALGTAEPAIQIPSSKGMCCVCSWPTVVSFQTSPRGSDSWLNVPLCAGHFRRSLGRCLLPGEHKRVALYLRSRGHSANAVYLFHDAFYDPKGLAVLPVEGCE
jgi:hypothetical protein